ncbi:MAG TPA: hypothetical protein VFN22_04420 [Gemmatimonadales bacterium]|nr:hypothetical protein [Gemmatimonadales bacterium]
MNSLGQVAFKDDGSDEHQVRLLDANGTVLSDLVPRGNGPGEMRSFTIVALTDSSLWLFGLTTLRVLELGLDGTVYREFPLPTTAFISAESEEGLLGLNVGPGGYGVVSVARDGTSADTIAIADSSVQRLFGTGPNFTTIIGWWGKHVVLAEGWSGRVAVVDRSGETVHRWDHAIAPNRWSRGEMLQEIAMARRSAESRSRPFGASDSIALSRTLADSTLPHFRPGTPPQVDADDRLWILRRQADTVVADVITRDGTVASVVVPCEGFRNGWSVAGRWLAVACANPDEIGSGAEASLKLFRIVD